MVEKRTGIDSLIEASMLQSQSIRDLRETIKESSQELNASISALGRELGSKIDDLAAHTSVLGDKIDRIASITEAQSGHIDKLIALAQTQQATVDRLLAKN